MTAKSEVITNKNFLLFCAKHYDNPNCLGLDEFKEDMQRIKYIKKLITRYIENNELKERLILNHIITLNNVFGPEILNRILYFKAKTMFKYIKPFLVFLNILSDTIINVETEGVIIHTDEIEMDQPIIDALRKI